MLSKQLITIASAITFVIGVTEASTSHVHLRIHSSMYKAKCDGKYDSPMSVEGIEGIFCVTGPACVHTYADGACPCADPEHGLPYGSYCGIVKTGVYGCKPCKADEPCDDKKYVYLEDEYNEENPMDCTYKKVPAPTEYDEGYTPEPTEYDEGYTPEPTKYDDVTPSPSTPEYDGSDYDSESDYGSEANYTPEPTKYDDDYTPEPTKYDDVTPSPSTPEYDGSDYGSESNYGSTCDWSKNGYPTVTYTYNGDDTANVKGTIIVTYHHKTHAKIKADLDFSGVQQSDLTAADGNCSYGATEYLWHIHVKWSSDKPYGSLKQCSLAATGGHYDPTKACGPASEYAGTNECLAKVASYNCTPETYSKDPLNCEQGDLGGKLGPLKLNDKKKVVYEWEDFNFPSFDEYSPTWNILFHPKCENKAAPRFVCAQGMLKNDPATYGC